MAILTIAFFSLTACDNDYKELGSSLVDNNNFDALKYDAASLEAHSEKIQKAQSNNLSSYALGVYNDDKFGRTTASIVTQLSLQGPNPNFGEKPEIDSVVLALPYFSQTVREEGTQENTYKLDSVFGKDPIRLSVYRSHYYLRNFDPNESFSSQAYYTDEKDKFEENLMGPALFTTNSLKPSNKGVTVIEPHIDSTQIDTVTRAPQIRVNLTKEKFQEWILDNAGGDQLTTNSNFQNYFRGLYIKAESVGDGGMMALFNLKSEEAGVYMYYTVEYENSDGEKKRRPAAYKLNLGSQIVNILENEKNTYDEDGESLYLKGGQGAMAVIDLFTDAVQLDSLRERNWLINEANLVFYVNSNQISAGHDHPQRLFIYDIKNKRELRDYALDPTINDNDALNSRTTHLGGLKEDEAGNKYYKIRITDYVNDILNKDSTNTKLGLVVSQNVNERELGKVEVGNPQVNVLPRASVLARNGTVLYGPASPSDKALRLEIIYTNTH